MPVDPDQTIKALGVPVRRHLFELICERPRSVADLAKQVPVSRPAVSQHLAVLTEAGLVRMTAVGTRNVYSASPDAAAGLRKWVDQMWTAAFGSFGDFATTHPGEGNNEMNDTIRIDPVAKTLHVELSPEAAFDLFVNRMGDWWPLATHSVAEDLAVGVRVDARVGGAIREVTSDGAEHEWGVISVFEPGSHFRCLWRPGSPADLATEVDLRFEAAGSGTRITLVHSGWEARGDDARRVRDGYESGWDVVLAPFVARASA